MYNAGPFRGRRFHFPPCSGLNPILSKPGFDMTTSSFAPRRLRRVFSGLTTAAALVLAAPLGATETCIGPFGLGMPQGDACRPFEGNRAKIRIDALAQTLTDTTVSRLRIVSDDAPDSTFDLSSLAGNESIRHLDIFRKGPVDLTPILAMKGLKSLSLSSDAALALAQLAPAPIGIEALRIYIPREPLDVSPLAGWHGLRILDTYTAGLSGTQALSNLTALERMHIKQGAQSDFSALAGLTALRDLSIEGVLGRAALDDIGFVTDLVRLEKVDFSGNQISDITALAAKPVLRIVTLSENRRLADISALASAKALSVLQLRQTDVSDLSPLAGLSELRILWLGRAPVSDIAPLRGLPHLGGVELSNTGVTDVSALGGAPIKHLDLRGTAVTDTSMIAAGAKIKK